MLIRTKEDFRGKCIKLEKDISKGDWDKMVEKFERLNFPIHYDLRFNEIKKGNVWVRPYYGDMGRDISNFIDKRDSLQKISLEEFLDQEPKTFENHFEAFAWCVKNPGKVIVVTKGKYVNCYKFENSSLKCRVGETGYFYDSVYNLKGATNIKVEEELKEELIFKVNGKDIEVNLKREDFPYCVKYSFEYKKETLC